MVTCKLPLRVSESTVATFYMCSGQSSYHLFSFFQDSTYTHPFNSPFFGTTWVSRYQKGKTNLDFTEARDSEWQWRQLGHMQVCTLLQTDNHSSTPPLSFLQAGCPSCRPTNSVKALKAIFQDSTYQKLLKLVLFYWVIKIKNVIAFLNMVYNLVTVMGVVIPSALWLRRYCRSGITLARRHILPRFIHLQAQGPRKGDEHPAYTPHAIWHTLPFYVCMYNVGRYTSKYKLEPGGLPTPDEN